LDLENGVNGFDQHENGPSFFVTRMGGAFGRGAIVWTQAAHPNIGARDSPTLDRYHSNRIVNETLDSGVFDEEHGTKS
jgi:hypothetical protein